MQLVREAKLDANLNTILAEISDGVVLGDNGANSPSNVALAADYTDEATFEVKLNGNGKLYLFVHALALGATMTGLTCLIEFRSPDNSLLWIPSKEGVSRDAGLGAHEWTMNGTGDWILTTRAEPRIFNKARFRFRLADASGAADGDTEIPVSWYHDGKGYPFIPEGA